MLLDNGYIINLLYSEVKEKKQGKLGCELKFKEEDDMKQQEV